MSYMTLEVQTENYFVTITGQAVVVWKSNDTDAMFMGTVDELAIAHPEVIQELLNAGAIKPSKDGS